VIKTTNSAGNNTSLNFPVSSMIPNAGNKNTLNFPAISMIFNAGANFFPACPVISKTLPVGKISTFIPGKLMLQEQ
jgi:hypothetical protein